MDILADFFPFLSRSLTVFHAAREITNRLTQGGFSPLKEDQKWKLEKGKGYFLMRGGSLVAAFRIPKEVPRAAVLLASHIDSPCLKLKPKSHEKGQLSTEVYGAPLLHTWLDRDLIIAGRITKKTSDIVTWEDFPVIIPSLALHLDRSVVEKGLIVNKQDHLKPILSIAGIRSFEKRLQGAVASDLFLVSSEKPSFVGYQNESIASPRLDNLTSAYAALYAMLHASSLSDRLQLALFWDHEEIGSMSHTGADSFFVDQILERICLCFKMDREALYQMKSRSLCISGDLAHGFCPNFADKFDPQNAPHLGKGVALKYNACQKYATNSETAASIIEIANRKKIPLQTFAGRSDIASGSTVGSIMAANVGIPTVDVGIPSWAMHSIRETIHAQDQRALCALFKAALEK